MSAATAGPVPRSTAGPIEIYRDDGPLARFIGRALGGGVGLPPWALLAAGAAPLFAVIVLAGDGASLPVAGAVIGWLVLVGGVSSGRPHADRLQWTVPPLLRLAEYGGMIWIAALAGNSSFPAAFAVLAAVAFRHYDLVYRLRYQGTGPPGWVGALGGGWDGRLLAGYALLVADALPAGLFVLAVALAAVFVGESVAGWMRLRRAHAPALYEDEEDEGG